MLKEQSSVVAAVAKSYYPGDGDGNGVCEKQSNSPIARGALVESFQVFGDDGDVNVIIILEEEEEESTNMYKWRHLLTNE